jgi:hypothetical protein
MQICALSGRLSLKHDDFVLLVKLERSTIIL